jgi:uncharacterized membrane protein
VIATEPNRQGLAAKRTMGGLVAAGATLLGTLLAGTAWPVAVVSAWGIAAAVIVTWVWVQVGGMDADETRRHAQAEDFSRPVADLVVLAAAVGSLVAVGYTLERAGNSGSGVKALLILLALSVVAVSWVTVHTLFTLRYGDLYYGHPVGGIDFNDDEPPDYRDFAYLAFTIGMTFQVSDTSLTQKRMRQVAIRHALLSFLFVAVIVAFAINSAASLLQ